MYFLKSHVAISLICLLALCNVQAATINYSVQAAALQSYWDIDYVLKNDDGPLFNEFTIYADFPSIIVDYSPPTGWTEYGVDFPNFDLFVPGYVYASRRQPVLVGEVVTFSTVVVSATPPSNQFFELGISSPFFILQSGFTAPAPELSTKSGLTMGLSVFAIYFAIRKRKDSHKNFPLGAA